MNLYFINGNKQLEIFENYRIFAYDLCIKIECIIILVV